MTQAEGRGVQALKRLLDAALERMARADARSFIDLLEHEEAADMAESLSAAGVATGTGGNLLYESLAGRIRSLVSEESPQCARSWEDGAGGVNHCVRPVGHAGGCSIFAMESEVVS